MKLRKNTFFSLLMAHFLNDHLFAYYRILIEPILLCVNFHNDNNQNNCVCRFKMIRLNTQKKLSNRIHTGKGPTKCWSYPTKAFYAHTEVWRFYINRRSNVVDIFPTVNYLLTNLITCIFLPMRLVSNCINFPRLFYKLLLTIFVQKSLGA